MGIPVTGRKRRSGKTREWKRSGRFGTEGSGQPTDWEGSRDDEEDLEEPLHHNRACYVWPRCGRTDLPGGNFETLKASLNRIKTELDPTLPLKMFDFRVRTR